MNVLESIKEFFYIVLSVTLRNGGDIISIFNEEIEAERD